ncbi:putative sodium-coupled neutral amino acid transporter 7 [Centruroides sculpturatus]|uniref:putative sodium-coupled neutral amino acid transporter 7 n=1 Tax=Centruroides sculpturatus TaxID=218467 RepID=UPI000C6DC3B4|nr:putative sodium-coupled neutral amino acid transporter 7 [Centruroides sculpturatus]
MSKITCSKVNPATKYNVLSCPAKLHYGSRTETAMATAFLQESLSVSIDIPSHIPWQSLSADLASRLKQRSLRISRSTRLDYKPTPIREEGEKLPLINGRHGEKIENEEEAQPIGVHWTVISFLLLNSALGCGILNFPNAFNRAGGVYVAFVLQLIMLCLMISTMVVLAYCADIKGDNTYHDVLLSMCGRRAQQCAAISILCSCFGVCIAFLVIIGDQYDRLLASLMGQEFCEHWFYDRKFTIAITTAICILPMCYFQRLDFLRYASALGIFAMLYPVFLTVYEYFMLDIPKPELKTTPDSIVDVFVAIPVICIPYQTHEVVIPVYSCMRERKLKNFIKATLLAMTILLFLYTITGTFGYITFGSKILPDVMVLYDASDPVVLIGIGALIVKMITTYPPLVLCGRGALDGLYAEFAKLTVNDFLKGEKKRRIIITSGWVAVTLFLALYTPSIGVVLEMLGCVAVINIFVFPGICLLQVILKHNQQLRGWKRKCLMALSCTMLLFGAYIFGVVFTQVVVFDIPRGGGGGKHNFC